MLTDDARYQAMCARDSRFDGVFFVGVRTTGIYCRPICPARTPGRNRCEFFATPALAERAGFRACFRCRPELAPGNASVDAVDALVAGATQRIAEGALNDGSLDELAGQLGVSARHLRRALEAKLGVSPVELAQSRRLALAKQLLQDTGLSLTEIAFAAGFGSVRRFNAVFAEKMGSSPSALRRKHVDAVAGDAVTLRLDYRAPYDWERLVGFLRGRAIPGVELVGDGSYRRVVHLGGETGELEVTQARSRDALQLSVSPALLPVLMPLVARVRRMFDLDARPDLINAALRRDKTLGPLIAKRPGLRVPGAIDPFEASIRALLGQQVSVAAATTLAGRFATQLGAPFAGSAGLTHRFPTAAEVVAAGAARIGKLGMPQARGTAIHTFAREVASGTLRLDAACELDAFVDQLVALPGIGPWTAHYLAMRALHVPDAFPAADLGVQKALKRAGAKAAEARAEAWRPFRAYAVLHLWTGLGD
ncbi:MAG TPA: AlkA N-terminal domain-containing protein [Kofleriaceae bacterium]|nr:AlkA N-terminal domain-containing protein [Kofleriaceae bacterium]